MPNGYKGWFFYIAARFRLQPQQLQFHTRYHTRVPGVLFLAAIAVAVLVAYNIGGATTAPAFAPSIGANLLSKLAAGGLMAAFFFLGAWTIGRRVVDTLGSEIVHTSDVFTPESSVIVLGLIGLGLLLGNLIGAPASTSMTTVGAIAGLGVASGQLDWNVFGEIVTWWLITPVLGFGLSAVAGRYYYATIEERVEEQQDTGRLLTLTREGGFPRPTLTPAGRNERLVGLFVIGIGCLMAFSSGTSNIANVIAPLVGSDQIAMNPGILFGSAVVAVGALTIGRRTLETLGNEIAALPLPGAFIVAPVSAILVTSLATLGIPASFVVIATFCIAGVGWGRTTRRDEADLGIDSIRNADLEMPRLSKVTSISDMRARSTNAAEEAVFDPVTTTQVVVLQHGIPAVVALGSYVTFALR